MRSRMEILKDLVYLQGNLIALKKELSQYSWDIEEPIFSIDKADFLSILNRAINNEVSFNELENWANEIECREDLSFEDEKIREIIFELANPELNVKITKNRLLEIANELA